MKKEQILDEIRRTADTNGGVPLGTEAFLRETGIKQTDWYGKFWARWGDAVREAGFTPNKLQTRFDDELLLEKFVSFIRELGRFPVAGEVRLKPRQDPQFPSRRTFERFGSKQQFAAKIIGYCESRSDLQDVIEICRPIALVTRESETEETKDADEEEFGFVYLLRSGRFYKIGKTNAAGRRERELAIQLPEKVKTVHLIRTDDPAGIEAYWHKRFDHRRKNGEWFELTASDIKAFKRRKFM